MRRPDWETRLTAVIERLRHRPHVYGQHDCILWPLTAAQAVTGKDYARGHRRKYNSAATASRYLRGLGFATPEAALDSIFDEKPVGFAQRGDLVMARDGIPAVCLGPFALSVGQEGNEEGLVPVARAQWVKAWAVGDHHSGELKLPRRRRKAA